MLLMLIAAIVLAVLAVVATIYVGVGLALMRMRKWCPQCRNKGLKRINSFLCNPPPNYSFFACDHCGGEFVQVECFGGAENPMIPRAGSPWERTSGWETPIQSDRRRRNIS
jgi:hypothetical protein